MRVKRGSRRKENARTRPLARQRRRRNRPTTSTHSHLDDGQKTMATTLFLAPGARSTLYGARCTVNERVKWGRVKRHKASPSPAESESDRESNPPSLRVILVRASRLAEKRSTGRVLERRACHRRRHRRRSSRTRWGRKPLPGTFRSLGEDDQETGLSAGTIHS